jgi:hypothetical protein
LINLAILLASLAAAIAFLERAITDRYGPQVAHRFLETDLTYDARSLRNWVENNPASARGYVIPVLFPLDFLFILCLGGFLGIGAIVAANTLHWSPNITWLLAFLPTAFVACDLAEDILISRLLSSPSLITDHSVTLAKTFTRAKFLTCTLSIIQTATVSAVGVIS